MRGEIYMHTLRETRPSRLPLNDRGPIAAFDPMPNANDERAESSYHDGPPYELPAAPTARRGWRFVARPEDLTPLGVLIPLPPDALEFLTLVESLGLRVGLRPHRDATGRIVGAEVATLSGKVTT
jgi:hypothetical protein